VRKRKEKKRKTEEKKVQKRGTTGEEGTD